MKRPRRVWNDVRSVPRSIKPVFPIVADETWRDRIERMNLVKFDDNAKLTFLQTLDETGKLGLACEAAGITTSTWRQHAQKDPKFYEAVQHTIDVFNANRAAKLERQALNGSIEVVFGPNGERSERRRYETQLRVMILKAADRDAYEDRSNVNVNVSHGAFIIPATLNPDDWEKQFAEQQSNFIPDTATPSILTTGEEQPVKRPRENE